MKKSGKDQILFWAGSLALTVFFLFLIRSCFYFSESFDVLAIKNIDELNFQMKLREARELLKQGQWVQVLANVHFGYGIIFWLPLTLISFPLVAWGPDWALIVLPRIISLVAYGFCLVAFYKICRHRKCTSSNAMIAVLLLTSCRGIFTAALYFHNNTLVAALVLWSLYFLVRPKERNNRLIACLLFSMALGMKIVAIFCLPVFLLFLNQDLQAREFFLPFSLWRNFKAIVLVLAMSVIFFSPTILFFPFGNLIFFSQSLGTFSYYLLHSSKLRFTGANSIFIDFYYLCSYTFAPPLFAIGLAGSFWQLTQRFNKKVEEILFPAVGVVSFLMIVIMISANPREPVYLKYYSIALIFTFALSFLDLPLRLKNISILLITVMLINFYLGWGQFKNSLFSSRGLVSDQEFLIKKRRFPFLLDQVRLDKDDTVCLDFEEIFPFGSLFAYDKVVLFYIPGESMSIKADVYMLSTKKMIQAEKDYFDKLKFEKLFADAGMEVYRRRR